MGRVGVKASKNQMQPKGPRQGSGRVAVLATLALSGLAGACVSFPSGDGGILREEIDAIVSEPPLDQVNWGIRVVDPERGQILYSRHANRKFVPASNMKLLATSTALTLLGPDFRYRTELLGVGPLEADGSLRGDLLLRPSGDPTFSARFYPSAEAPLDSLAEGLWAAGIRRVTGSLVVDVSSWDSTTVRDTWMTGDLSAAYAATGGAFSLADGVLTVEVTAGSDPGAPARARWWPFLGDEFVSVGLVTVHPDSSTSGRGIHYLPESKRMRIEGKIRAAEVDTLRISQRDPVPLASGALLHALERRGIRVEGGLRIAWDGGDPVGPGLCATGLAPRDSVGGRRSEIEFGIPGGRFEGCSGVTVTSSITSPPLAEILQAILEPSQNWMTEQLVRSLGAFLGEEGSWREGFQVEEAFFTQEVGVDSLDITFRDGSGLSAYNLVTPRAVVRILEFMWASPNAGTYKNALASPGEEDSTLENRLESLNGRVFAKTGTITHVNSLSGYVFTNSGRELIFSILTNGSGLPSGTVRDGIDRIMEIVARQ